jgi:hypothetical protein
MPKNSKNSECIRFRASNEQAAALRQIADERDTPVAVILANALAAATGVPDTLTRNTVRKGDQRRRRDRS